MFRTVKLIKRSLWPPCLHIQAVPLNSVVSRPFYALFHIICQRMRNDCVPTVAVANRPWKNVRKIKRTTLFKVSSSFAGVISAFLTIFQAPPDVPRLFQPAPLNTIFKTLAFLIKCSDTRRPRAEPRFHSATGPFCNDGRRISLNQKSRSLRDFFALTTRSRRRRGCKQLQAGKEKRKNKSLNSSSWRTR